MAAVEERLENGRLNGTSPDRDHSPADDQGGDPFGDDDDGDLFGDDNEAADDNKASQRRLDDEELDSGDDDGRQDRVAATIEEEDDAGDAPDRPAQLLSADIARISHPEGDELYVLNIPPFLGVKQRNYDAATYDPPDKPHDGITSEQDPTRKFSAFSTATTSMFWRRDPKDPELIQSNARFVRWSDGSLTLQLASRPQEHYRVSHTALRQNFGKKPGQHTAYDVSKDSNIYLAVPHGTPGVDLQIVRPVDAAMKIMPTRDHADESVLRLKQTLAAVQEAHDPLGRLKVVEEDPELARKAAEAFEKEKTRTMRKREAAEDRLLQRRDRVLGRSGGYGGGGRSAGLSVAGLEADDDGMPSTKSRTKRRKIGASNRRGEIYSDDEDSDAPRRRTREDEYDREDDFLASSDEEPETYEDGKSEEELLQESDEDKDDLEIEGRETVVKGRTRGVESKRSRMDEIEGADDDDDDAEGDEDTELISRQNEEARKRQRRVIDDDEDEDE